MGKGLRERGWRWWRKHWLESFLIFYFPETIKSITTESLTDAIHPEFGWVWKEEEKMGQARKQWGEGWKAAIDAVRVSLQSYPHGGGDIHIMKEVERLIKEGRSNIDA